MTRISDERNTARNTAERLMDAELMRAGRRETRLANTEQSAGIEIFLCSDLDERDLHTDQAGEIGK